MRLNNQSSLFNEGMKLVSFCPVCQHKGRAMEAKVLEKTEAAHLVHLHCNNCRAAVLALIMISPTGLNSVGMVTDLSANDALKFKNLGGITEEDVLELHQANQPGQNWLNSLL